ncbi:MAG TPA: hypothetical protein VGX25_04770 [Actinophytocola sp.]|uniref:hypothetical protein n=1 Tax=Actinophytocola sp. TaxID=1872138 RepID=UPI002DDD017D|nr:hypothetical protein [Actinophytocola sp.]HEV2778695.1 hypothetical protein [Actinophytocola sp.]
MIHLDIRHDLRDLARALKAEEDGKQLRKDLVRNLKQAVDPAVKAAKAAVHAMPSRGHAGPSLRRDVARRTGVQVKLGGRTVGVKVRTTATKVRGFTNAPRLLNARKGWRHPNIGAGRRGQPDWVAQRSPRPGWFDDEMRRPEPRYRAAVVKAVEDMQNRIARRH